MPHSFKYYLSLIVIFVFLSCKQDDASLVKDISEFDTAVENAKPGDVITLANGVWKDTELLFEAKGTKEQPITLTVEEKGKVSLEGQSNLKIAGEHLIVEGLIFKNGYTPTNEVISFKKDKKTLANNCRLTECVIDNYSQIERHEPDTWIAIYGKNNRVDHNHLMGKGNRGVTMTVRLNSKESQENHHKIDHNYFGPRQSLGSNGGESLRIGTSHYSLSNSNTLVESNFFDRCNGEVEIISSKSCQNTFKNNVFFECAGTLTMRHGNETLVDSNIFIGNGKASTGGIRVINGQQKVINNYAVGLTGYRFRGALVVMNGIYNSPLNRYFQVKDAVIKNNTYLNCDNVLLCVGSDAERNAPPVNSVMENNIFYNENKDEIFEVFDDISGIAFNNNITSSNIKPLSNSGFIAKDLTWTKNNDGLLMPSMDGAGAKLPESILKKSETGVSWYSKEEAPALNSGKTIKVEAGLNTLFDAAKNSSPGDILQLTSSENYTLTKTIPVKHALSFVSSANEKPTVLFEKKALFEIQNGGSLSLKGIRFDGEDAPDRTGNSVITTSKYSMNKNYKLFIDNCDFDNLDVNHSYDAIRVYKNTLADTISITNSNFKTISGNVMALDRETDDIGIYNAEYVILKNNSYQNIDGAALILYRGGKDESTIGPVLKIDHCTFDNVGNGKRNKYQGVIDLYGVQVSIINNSIFNNSKGIYAHLVVGEPIVNMDNNNFYKSDKIKISGDQKYSIGKVWTLNPEFSEASLMLSSSSALKGKATDGNDLGITTN